MKFLNPALFLASTWATCEDLWLQWWWTWAWWLEVFDWQQTLRWHPSLSKVTLHKPLPLVRIVALQDNKAPKTWMWRISDRRKLPNMWLSSSSFLWARRWSHKPQRWRWGCRSSGKRLCLHWGFATTSPKAKLCQTLVNARTNKRWGSSTLIRCRRQRLESIKDLWRRRPLSWRIRGALVNHILQGRKFFRPALELNLHVSFAQPLEEVMTAHLPHNLGIIL